MGVMRRPQGRRRRSRNRNQEERSAFSVVSNANDGLVLAGNEYVSQGKMSYLFINWSVGRLPWYIARCHPVATERGGGRDICLSACLSG
jgi:hypothetical protein